MRSIGGAVGQRQIADANTDGVFLHFNHWVTIVAGHLRDMAVQVQRHGAGNGQELLMLMFAASLTVSTVESAIAAVSSSAVRISFTVSPAAGITPRRSTPSMLSPAGADTSLRAGLPHRLRAGRTLHSPPAMRPPRRRRGNPPFIFPNRAGCFTAAHGRGFRAFLCKAAVGTRHSTIHRVSRC